MLQPVHNVKHTHENICILEKLKSALRHEFYMDATDRKLLVQLDKDPRMTEKALGKTLRISQQVVSYRLKKLYEKGELLKIAPSLDLARLGLEHYRIFFKFHKVVRQKQLFEFLKKHPRVFWAARIGGKYDLVIVFFVKDYLEFDAFLEELNSAFPSMFRDYDASYGLYHEYYGHKTLNKKAPLYLSSKTGVPVEKIDDLDKKVLMKMKNDVRQSSLSVGQKLGVSYKTVQNRMRALRERKIILGSRIFISSADSERFIVLLSFRNYAKKKETTLMTELRMHENVTQAVRLFGKWDLFLHVRAKDMEDIQNVLIDLREKYDLIDEFELVPVFEDININVLPLK